MKGLVRMVRMPLIQTNLRFGLSLLYEYCCVFSKFKSTRFRCGFHRANVIWLRNEKYANLIREVVQDQLLDFENVTIEDAELPDLSPPEVYEKAASAEQGLPQTEQWTPDNRLIREKQNHIIMNTKLVFSSEVALWDATKTQLFSMLNTCGRKLILVGEREPMQCKEYQIHSSRSIYREILDGCHCVEDQTVDDTMSLYTKERLKHNLNLLQTSAFNIHIGRGGGQSVYSFHNDMITLGSGVDFWWMKYYSPRYVIDVCPTSNEFIDCLSKRLEV
jgi:hypothetical protein